MKRWEIYWAEVKFEETEETKTRPVVIINDTMAFVLAFGVYSQIPRPGMNDYVIRDWEKAGLQHQSTIHTDRMIKIDKSKVSNKIGELSKRDSMILALYNDL